jgi:hypothetical protein
MALTQTSAVALSLKPGSWGWVDGQGEWVGDGMGHGVILWQIESCGLQPEAPG